MPEQNAVLDEIQREIKGFGDNVTGLKASLEKDLADVRKVAEEAKGAIGPEVKAQIDALSTSVAEKQSALETQVKAMQAQADRVETALNRHPTGPSQPGDAAEMKDAVAFFEAKAAINGTLKSATRPNAESIDRDGYRAWQRAFDIVLRHGHEQGGIDTKALSVGSNPDGGYLVPTATSNRIIQAVREISPLRQLATVETIGGTELEIPIDVGDLEARWVGETQDRTTTGTPEVGIQKIAVHELEASPKATQRVLEDAAINVEAWLAGKVADRFARAEATAFVTGNGVDKPRGILSYDAGTGRNKLPQIVSGDANLITANAIVKLPFEIKSAYLANARWLMKRSTVQAVMLLQDEQKQYLWRPGLAAGQPSTLGGYVVEMADDMPIVAAGALPIAFGDFRRGYTVVDRLGLRVLRNPYKAPPWVIFSSYRRVGGAVVDFDAIVLMKVASA